jgi:uncharacterized membrane protein
MANIAKHHERCEMTIRNPILWGWDALRPVSADSLARAGERLATSLDAMETTPGVRHIGLDDLKTALDRGWTDFTAGRTDVIMLCLLYPIVGLVMGRLGLGHEVVPLLFPLAAGFALLGPLFGIGLNEMSRQRELGQPVTWRSAFAVLEAPSLGAIIGLGLLLTVIFLAWLASAGLIWRFTLGDVEPASVSAFFTDVFTTSGGMALIAVGVSVGFVFAAVVFSLLLDRHASVRSSIRTSLRVVAENPRVMLAWGAIVTAGLVLGSIPAFIGLAVVLPVLGHATWHLYRLVVR